MFDKTKWVWRIDLTLITANLKENLFKFNKNGSCIKHESCKGPSGSSYSGCYQDKYYSYERNELIQNTLVHKHKLMYKVMLCELWF